MLEGQAQEHACSETLLVVGLKLHGKPLLKQVTQLQGNKTDLCGSEILSVRRKRGGPVGFEVAACRPRPELSHSTCHA